MTESLFEIEARRARWHRHRELERLVPDADDDFACGGLGSWTDELELRALFLAADPHVDRVPLNGELLGRIKESREAPYCGQGPTWGSWDSRRRLHARPRRLRYESDRPRPRTTMTAYDNGEAGT
jgi:hypothetical protein